MTRRGMEKTESLLEKEELKITSFIIKDGFVNLLVSELNESNMALEGTIIEGKRVRVLKLLEWER